MSGVKFTSIPSKERFSECQTLRVLKRAGSAAFADRIVTSLENLASLSFTSP